MSVCAVYAARHWLTYDGFIGASRDEVIYLPAILKNSDPALYPDDFFLSNFQVATSFFLDLSSGLLSLAGGDYRIFLLSTSTALLFVFISGVFAMMLRLTGSPAAALLAGLLLLRPREAMGSVGFAVYVGNYQPRIFIDAITPWVFWALLRFGPPGGPAVVGFILGLASCFYPVYPVQLSALLVLILLFMKRGRDAGLLALTFSVPFVACHFQSLVAASQPLTEAAAAVIERRWYGQFYPRGEVLAYEFIRNFALTGAFAAAGAAASPGLLSGRPGFRYILLVVPAAAALMAAGYLSYDVPALLPLMPQRLGRLFHLVFISIGAAGTAALMERKGRVYLKFLLLGLLSANLCYTGPVPPVRTRETAAVTSTAAEKKDFLFVAEAARELTPRDAVFMIPPRGADNFQLYSRRSVVVSYKNLSSILDPKVLEYWDRACSDVAAAYASGDPGRIKETASLYGAEYVLFSGTAAPAGTPVFSSGGYSVYRTEGIRKGASSGKGI
jgi:hypothetical protein